MSSTSLLFTNTFRLAEIGGEWHEFESKAHRRQNENAKKAASEAQKAAASAATNANANATAGNENKKRPAAADGTSTGTDAGDGMAPREAKRQQTATAARPVVSAQVASTIVSAISDATSTNIAAPVASLTVQQQQPEPGQPLGQENKNKPDKMDDDAGTEPALISPPPPPEPELGEPAHPTGSLQQ